MRAEHRRLAVVSLALLVVGTHGVRNPPGFFGFLATECPPVGDCANYLAPFVGSVISLGTGFLLGLLVVVLVARERLA